MLVSGELGDGLVLASRGVTPVCYLLSFYFLRSRSFTAQEARTWSWPAKPRRKQSTSIPRLEASQTRQVNSSVAIVTSHSIKGGSKLHRLSALSLPPTLTSRLTMQVPFVGNRTYRVWGDSLHERVGRHFTELPYRLTVEVANLRLLQLGKREGSNKVIDDCGWYETGKCGTV